MRKFIISTLLAGAAFAGQAANAAIVIDTNNLVTAENVLFNQSAALSTTQVGQTNTTNFDVTFTNTLGLIADASGQSSVYNTAAFGASYLLGVTTFALDAGHFFSGAEFNLPGIPGGAPPIEATSVLVEALGLNLSVLGFDTVALGGNGENRIRVFGNNSEQIRGVRLTLNPSVGGVSSLTQVRIGGAGVEQPPVVPEPTTWAMMLVGFGAVGYAMRRRRNVAVSFA